MILIMEFDIDGKTQFSAAPQTGEGVPSAADPAIEFNTASAALNEVSLETPGSAGVNDWQRKSGQAGSLIESFYHAFNGLVIGFRTQRNIRVHTCIAIAMVIMAIAFKVSTTEAISLALACGFVFFAEFVNTAIEHMVDIQANYRYHLSARYAKDTAAAAVLIAALTALAVGSAIFAPRILALLSK